MQYKLINLDWQTSPVVTLAVVREAFQSELLPALEQAALAHWKEQAPASHRKQITRQLRAGLRQGLVELTMRAPADDAACWNLLSGLPSDWEPSDAETPVDLPAHQSRAYRWTAALLASRVRNAIEDLHAAFTAHASMNELNQRICHTVYSCLLRNPPVIWRLSEVPRTVVSLMASGLALQQPMPAPRV